ncbi:beta-1,6-N-acetylglucosaminyltransferase, partial [Chloroflexota bacterium]
MELKTMKIAYVCPAYKNPSQVKRLVEALRYPNVSFYIHIDRKVDAQPFHDIFPMDQNEDVHFVHNRAEVNWGGFGLTQATLNALQQIRSSESEQDLDYLFLLTAQDYPLMSNKDIVTFLEARKGKEFISYAKMPTPFWATTGGMWRIERYHFDGVRFGRYLRILAHWFLPKRKPPKGFTPYGGSTWWCLTYDCVKYVLEFVEHNPKFVNFYKRAHIPDEMFFATIIMNSPFAENVVSEITNKELEDDIRYLRWNKAHPVLLRKEDLHTLMASGKLFARKFDDTVDSEIIDLVQ